MTDTTHTETEVKHEVGLFRFVETATDYDKARVREALRDYGLEVRPTSEDVEEDFGVFSDE